MSMQFLILIDGNGSLGTVCKRFANHGPDEKKSVPQNPYHNGTTVQASMVFMDENLKFSFPNQKLAGFLPFRILNGTMDYQAMIRIQKLFQDFKIDLFSLHQRHIKIHKYDLHHITAIEITANRVLIAFFSGRQSLLQSR